MLNATLQGALGAACHAPPCMPQAHAIVTLPPSGTSGLGRPAPFPLFPAARAHAYLIQHVEADVGAEVH